MSRHSPHPWLGLSDVPPEIRETMSRLWVQWDRQDLALDSTLSLIHSNPTDAQQVGTVSRAIANRSRIPAFCEALHRAHGLSWRATWHAIGHFLGLHPSHVQRLYYRGEK